MSRRDWRTLDESDVRVRPGKGSRPRSKQRPRHANASRGMVTAVDRGRWTCAVDGDSDHLVTAMRARELSRTPIVVGDTVALTGDVSGTPDSMARIVRVEQRSSVLRRTADDTYQYERVVVANAGQLLIVTSLADPAPKTGFIDRCLVACYVGGLEPVLCLTKSDLAAPDDLLAHYADLGVPAIVLSQDSPLDEIYTRLHGTVSALVGQSGVGKSTLVNRLVPQAELATGVVGATGKGRHTSVGAVALPLPESGWIVDTPGIRSFGLAHIAADDIVRAFPEFAAGAEECPPGCEHLSQTDDPGCALDGFATDRASLGRLTSLRRLLASHAGIDPAE